MDSLRLQKLEDLLLVSVPAELNDSDVLQLKRMTLQAVKLYRSRWVLLDFSQVEVCDSFFGRFIHTMTETVRMMGARVVISALQDAVVETLVEMGFSFPGVQAVLDLDDALALSRETLALDLDDDELVDASLMNTTDELESDVDFGELDDLHPTPAREPGTKPGTKPGGATP